MQGCARHERSLIIPGGYFSIWPNSNSIRCTKSTCINRHIFTIGGHFDHRTMLFPHSFKPTPSCPYGTTHGKVKISFGIGMQIKTKCMKALRVLPVVIEIFQKVGFAISIKIMKTGNLIISDRVDFFIHDFQSEWFMQTGGKSFPGYLFQFFINMGNNPYIPVPGTYRRSLSVLKKIKSTDSHLGFMWVIKRNPDLVDHIGISLIIRKFTFGGDGITPLS